MSKKIVKLKNSELVRMVKEILSEQVQQAQPAQNAVLYTDNFDNVFESGQYKFTPSYQQVVQDHVNKLVDFIKGRQLSNFKIVISSGESKVTNQAPFDKVPGSLAKARAEFLEQYLSTYLQKILNFTPTIEITQPVIGTTPYTAGVNNKDDQRYKQEQFVKVSVLADYTKKPTPTPTPKPVQSPNKGFVINVRGDERNNLGAYYFPQTLADWQTITKNTSLTGVFATVEQQGTDSAQATVDMNDNVFKGYISKTPELISILGPAYLRDRSNPNNFILKK